MRAAVELALGLAALLLPLFAAPALAQGFDEAIDVEEVVLDVVVTDAQGSVVTDLERADFIVREDGEPVDIQSVTFYGHRPDAITDDGAAHRYFILFFHHQHTLLPRLRANLLDAGRRAKQWVRGSLSERDFVAVVSYFPRYHLLDFTNDAGILTATIDEAVQGKAFTATETRRPTGIPSLAEHLPPGDVERIYEALSVTAEAAGAVRGRKNLILFSIGFGVVDGFGFYRPDARYYPEMVQTLNDNHVAVYAIDLLANDLSPFFRSYRLQHVLSRLAFETDGRLFFNFTNYLGPLEQIAEANEGYYLIAFTPAGDPSRGTYRRVEVDTKDPRLDTRAREGYVVGGGYPYGESP